MSNIKITFKDGKIREFKHEGRAGGSWTKELKYVEGFVVVEDEWQNRISFPSTDIAEIEETPERSW